ncbi:transposase [Pyrenophora seminiperda CCB06]|uniref:Transposase n=1 Tax=Pyrenophora seminiperda CCB06 TaxID=1302712 RepID=A0A3M7M038_9PLEO|nr:transposase [Pyrenophora seminiperda CCB06]
MALNVHDEINLTSSNRIRCAGHIINLVVKATLYGKGVSRFEAQLAAASPAEQYEIFRSHGVVGKLHNFKEPRDDNDDLYTYNTLQLRQDGGVRWHLVYYMLLRCLELRNPITRFMTRLQQQPSQRLNDEYNPLTDELSSEEWEGVQQLVDFLQAPVEMTKRLEGNNSASGFGSLWQTLTNLQALWKLYSSTKAGFDGLNNSNSDYFIAAVKHGLEKLSSYFEKLIIEPEYADWVKRAKDSTNRVFKQYIAKEIDDDDDDTALPLPRRKVPGGNADLYSQTMAVDLMFLTGSKSHKRQKRTSQLEEYFDDLRDDLTNASEQQLALLHDPWRWWLEIGRNKYPVVFKIATDYLSIPATSCECERSFSTAKRTITSDRNSLSAATIEALQLQKNWLRHGVVDSEVLKLQQHVQSWDSKQGSSNKSSNSDVAGGGSEVAGNSGNNSYLGDDVG